MTPADRLSVFNRMHGEQQAGDIDRLREDLAAFLARNCGLLAPDDISLLSQE
ncbi:hypothetical protein FHX57_007589 [Paraburkholderia tropica]|uniref:hypothetical protein n=1 Tax=Paraburkholderia tropica TaxID=92647 RepID=UPI0015E8C923|nr:hypothetical protein [Paraburkholderia tropica]MBB2984743.1 hypothetical protein [Paraburkholderia tropica]MBB3005201.1 hypothetical protein [Paraburkholderia tropica]MBB6324129.1 hypothetical protein [Paraburkholderia tropica]